MSLVRDRLVEPIQQTVPDPVLRVWRPVLVVVLAALPLLPPVYISNSTLSLLTEVFIFAIFAMSYDILIGYTGVVSFGHALPFGLAAYTLGLLLKAADPLIGTAIPFIPAAIITVAIVTIVSAVIGYLAFQVSGVYFSLITLAFAQLFYEASRQLNTITGGANGLSGVPAPPLVAGLFPLDNPANFYWLTLVLVAGCYLAIRRLLNSPLGKVFVAIRENDTRARAIGLDVFKFKLAAFTFAGLFAAIGGMLYGPYLNFVSPITLYWNTGGNALLMTLIGGMGSLWGPLAGAAFLVVLRDFVSSITDLWLIVLGVIYVVFVIFIPQGFAGLITGEGDVMSFSELVSRIRP
ncbi:MAG: branched-chain amino acid ABC transporter permease [Haloplanus sp.]